MRGRVGDLGPAHFGDVGEGGLRVKAEVGEDGAGEHARAADAGVAVEGDMLALLNAGCDGFGEGGEGCWLWQVHVADGVIQEGDAICGAGVTLGLKANFGSFLRLQERNDCGDASGARSRYIIG